MKNHRICFLGVSLLLAASAVSAHAQPVSAVNQSLAAQADVNALPRVPLARFGGFDVQVWAPVAPPYDPDANRNLASDPSWGMMPGMVPPVF